MAKEVLHGILTFRFNIIFIRDIYEMTEWGGK
jgi:hypothetical protein